MDKLINIRLIVIKKNKPQKKTIKKVIYHQIQRQ